LIRGSEATESVGICGSRNVADVVTIIFFKNTAEVTFTLHKHDIGFFAESYYFFSERLGLLIDIAIPIAYCRPGG
jgi:hypothetical protein